MGQKDLPTIGGDQLLCLTRCGSKSEQSPKEGQPTTTSSVRRMHVKLREVRRIPFELI